MNLNFSFSAFYMTAYWTRKFCENYCSMAAAKFVKFNCLDWSPVNECEKNIHLTFTFKRFFLMNCSWTVSCKKCASGRSLCWQWRRRRAHLWSLVSPCVPSVGWPITRHRATVNGGDSPQTRERGALSLTSAHCQTVGLPGGCTLPLVSILFCRIWQAIQTHSQCYHPRYPFIRMNAWTIVQ